MKIHFVFSSMSGEKERRDVKGRSGESQHEETEWAKREARGVGKEWGKRLEEKDEVK